MKKLIVMVLCILVTGATGCENFTTKYPVEGCFVYQIVTATSEKLEESEYYVRIRELSEYGKQQKYIIVPRTIEGYPVKEIGKPDLLAGLYAEWDSAVVEKIYFQGNYTTGPQKLIGDCPKLKKYFLLGSVTNLGFSSRAYVASNSKNAFASIANTSFYYNYSEAPNEGFYWIDDLDDEKIEVVPSDPARAGYVFCGWYKEPECINKWDFDTDKVPAKEYDEEDKYIYRETCLYAKWDVE